MNSFRQLQRSVYLLLVAGAALLSACGTRPIAMGLVEKPSSPTNSVHVLYVDSRLSSGKDTLSSSTSSVLYRLGYFDIGNRITKIAPELLVKRGLSAGSTTMREEVFAGGGMLELNANYASGKHPRLLTLYFTGGQSRDYGGPGATMTLQAQFREMNTYKLYWKGEYSNTVRDTLFGGVKFDDSFVQTMLEQVFADMETFELLPTGKQK